MNLLDAIEKAVGSEYFGDKSSELHLAIQRANLDKELSLHQPEQPHANKVVLIK